MNTTQLNVLLVEDSPEDIDMIQEAFGDSLLQPRMSIVTDGEEALDYLYKKEQYSHTEDPDLIILDLNLPKKSGHEVLSRIKLDPHLKATPVVILSTSRSPVDIIKSYQNYSNCYICKPLQYEDFMAVIKKIENFWFDVVQLPSIHPRKEGPYDR